MNRFVGEKVIGLKTMIKVIKKRPKKTLIFIQIGSSTKNIELDILDRSQPPITEGITKILIPNDIRLLESASFLKESRRENDENNITKTRKEYIAVNKVEIKNPLTIKIE
jgi:hypothetical protein